MGDVDCLDRSKSLSNGSLNQRIVELENQLKTVQEQRDFYSEFYRRHKDRIIDYKEPQNEEGSQNETNQSEENCLKPMDLGKNIALEYTRDSPMFRSHVEAFEESMGSLKEYMTRLINDTTDFIASGRQMRQAGLKMAETFCDRKHSRSLFTNSYSELGQLTPDLLRFSEIFRQIQDSINILLCSLEQGLLQPLQIFVRDYMKDDPKKLKKKVWTMGEKYQLLLQQVLDGKKVVEGSELYSDYICGDKLTDLYSDIMDARWNYELGRYDIVQYLNNVDGQKKIQLVSAINSAMYAFLGYFQGGAQLMVTQEKRMAERQAKLLVARKEFDTEQQLWANVRLRLEAELAGALPPPGAPPGALAPLSPRGLTACPPYLTNLATEVLTLETQRASHRDTRHARDEGVLKQGYLHSSRSLFSWGRTRNWYRLHGGSLYVIKDERAGENDLGSEFLCDVRSCSAVAKPGRVPFCFIIVNDEGYRLELQAENEDEMVRWIAAIRRCRHQFSKDSSVLAHRENRLAADKVVVQLLNQLLEKNSFCAECGCNEVDWISVNIGVSLCSDCATVHRNLGVRISQLKSVMLDNWSKIVLQCHLQCLGNEKVNSIWENCIPEGWEKPKPNSNMEQRENWIVAKYQWYGFIAEDRSPKEEVSKLLVKAAEEGDVNKAMWCIAHKGEVNWRHPEKNFQTPLHMSVIGGHRNCTAYLLLNGADLYIEDKNGKTAIHMAGQSPLKDITHMFVERERGELW